METEKIIEKKEIIHDENRRNWATKGEALGVGIPALAIAGITALKVFGGNRGLTGGWGGGSGTPENVNINTMGGGYGGGQVAPTAFDAYSKECEDALALTSALFQMRIQSMNERFSDRQVLNGELFGLYQSQTQADFGLYKNQRDQYDSLKGEIDNLKCQVAVGAAIRPYQDKLIQCEIDKAFTAGISYTDRKTCRMIQGELVLPSTPLVTGYSSYNSCCGPMQVTPVA